MNPKQEDDQRTFKMTKDKVSLEQYIKTLKESEKRFRIIFEHANEAIVVAQDEVVKYFNSQFTELIGYSEEEVRSTSFAQYIHPDDLEKVSSEYRLRLSGEKSKNSYTARILTKDGQEKFALINSTLVNWEGRPATLAVVTDITQLKKAESDLRRSEERFRHLIEQSPMAMEILSPDGKINTVNNAWKKLWKVSDEEVAEGIDKYNMLTDPQLERLGIMDQVKEAFKGKHTILPPIQYDTGQTMKDFEIQQFKDFMSPWIQCHLNSVKNEEGNIVYVINTYVDITDLKKAGEIVQKSEERFRNLMEQSPLATAIVSPKGQIIEVNSAWYKQWGLTREEAAKLFANYNNLTDKQHQETGVAPLIDRAFMGEQVILPPVEYIGNRVMQELELEDIEANTVWIQTHYYPVKDKNGEIEYVVATNMDVTKLKQAEEKAEEQRESLARMDRASSMGQLTASIAHELNQPLTGILSNAQAAELMIKKGIWEVEEFKEILTDIINDTKRGGEVIRNLKELYQKKKVEFLPFNLTETINDTMQLLHSELVMKNIVIDVKCKPSIPILNGNKVQIQQVLVNLIINGIQAMENNNLDSRLIQIQTTYNDKEVSTSVIDYGIGIDPDKIDSIFEPLATWKSGGTGMGLAISNSIVESHGGRMWAENRPAGGALVGFSLPLIKIDFNKNE